MEIWSGELERLSEGASTLSEVVEIFHFLRHLLRCGGVVKFLFLDAPTVSGNNPG